MYRAQTMLHVIVSIIIFVSTRKCYKCNTNNLFVNVNQAPGDWTGWSEWLCNMCGAADPGVESRARTCTGDAVNCPGNERETRDPCPEVSQQFADGMKPR